MRILWAAMIGIAALSCEKYNDTIPEVEPQYKNSGNQPREKSNASDEIGTNPPIDKSGDQGGKPSNTEAPKNPPTTPDNNQTKTDETKSPESPSPTTEKTENEPKRGPVFSVESMIINLSYNIGYANLTKFTFDTENLKTKLENYCEKPADDPNAIETLRNQWLETMNSWQRIEASQYGPIAENGYKLRKQIYSWDISSQPKFSLREAARAVSDSYQLPNREITKGLDAIESSIFNPNLGPLCKNFQIIPEDWTELSSDEQQIGLCRYLNLVVDDLLDNTYELRNSWQSEGGNYLQRILGNGSDVDLKKAVNAITDSLYFFDTHVKDKKLKIPMQRHPDACIGPNCQCFVENRYSKSSLNSIKSNAKTFLSYITGKPEITIKSQKSEVIGLGLAAYLIQKQERELAISLVQKTTDLINQLDQLSGISLYELAKNFNDSSCPLAEGSSNAHPLCRLYDATKAASDLFKNNLMKALELELPSQSGGDGD